MQVKVNNVVGSDTSIHDVTRIKEFCMGNGIEWCILTNWNQEESSIQRIDTFLQSIGAVRDGANLKGGNTQADDAENGGRAFYHTKA